MCFIDRVTSIVLFTILSALLLASSFPVHSKVEVPTRKLKDRFFSSLTDSQKIKLLREIDRARQLTSFELGAKYRWGRIPPDRQPPFQLARWWESLTPLEKRKQRLQWFQENYRQLNLDRATRILGLQERLTKMYRKLAAEQSRKSSDLEPVPFPGSDLTFADTSGPRQLVYRQPGSKRVFRPDESKKQTKSKTQISKNVDEAEQRTRDTSRNRVDNEKSKWKRKRRFGDQVIIYKKEDGGIKVIRKDAGGDTITKDELFGKLDERAPSLRELNILNIPHPYLRRNRR